MSGFKHGDRVKFTARRQAFDGLQKYTGQTATTGSGDTQGRVVTFDDGFESYAFDDELEVTS